MALRILQVINRATHPGCQTDKDTDAANGAATQDKTTSAE
jgi:hypothetical protein